MRGADDLGAEPSHSRSHSGEMAQAAGVISLGNVASRLLGLAREMVIADLFGATGLVSAFRIAAIVPTILYDLLIGGMVSSALVPVFSGYAEKDRDEMWRLASLTLGLATVTLALATLVIELFAPAAAWMMSGGLVSWFVPGGPDPVLLHATTRLLRITTPAVLFLSISGIISGLLYALRRFSYPAFTASVFNAGVVAAAIVLGKWMGWGIEGVAAGMLIGSMLQVALQLPGLRDAPRGFWQTLHAIDLKHAGLRRIGKLYVPVVLGLVISQVGIIIDRNLASHTGEQSIAWMQYATTLIQFPLGLVATAVSLAILPTLSRLAARPEESGESFTSFMETLATGIKLVLVLIIPAAVGLFVLARPVVALIFEHGDFTPADTGMTALALRLYMPGLVFAAIDQPLVFAFYARQNTLTPAIVGVLGVGVYLAAAILPLAWRELRMTDLVIANSVQLTAHALVMLYLVGRIGTLRGRGISTATLKSTAASVVMGGIAYGIGALLFWPGASTAKEAAAVGAAALVGCAVYGLLLYMLRVPELSMLLELARSRLSRKGYTRVK